MYMRCFSKRCEQVWFLFCFFFLFTVKFWHDISLRITVWKFVECFEWNYWTKQHYSSNYEVALIMFYNASYVYLSSNYYALHVIDYEYKTHRRYKHNGQYLELLISIYTSCYSIVLCGLFQVFGLQCLIIAFMDKGLQEMFFVSIYNFFYSFIQLYVSCDLCDSDTYLTDNAVCIQDP